MNDRIAARGSAARIGGWALIVAAISFMAVFGYLAATFNYPDVLDGTAAEVLPQLLALGTTGRAVWVLYALLPLLLIPAGIGAHAALRQSAPNAMRMAVVLSVVTAVSMLLGLARWPTIHWEMAQAWGAASPATREALGVVFGGLNLYLGNFIGEFLGEVALSAFFALTAFAFVAEGRGRLGMAGYVAAGFGFVASVRNVTDAVEPVAAINNYVLPIWLIVLGVVVAGLGRDRAR